MIYRINVSTEVIEMVLTDGKRFPRKRIQGGLPEGSRLIAVEPRYTSEKGETLGSVVFLFEGSAGGPVGEIRNLLPEVHNDEEGPS